MSTITAVDVPRVSAAIRSAGELLEVHGDLMLTLTNDWAAGAKAANLDPDSHGNRWETDDDGVVWAVPADPTGEAAINARNDTAKELQKRIQRMHADALWIRDMAHVLAPIALPSTVNQPKDDSMWCANHLRVGICEPRYRGTSCRACTDFRALWKTDPPPSLLKDRHHGKRWTDKSIKAALAAEGLIYDEVEQVSKAINGARGRTGKANQNQKRSKAS